MCTVFMYNIASAVQSVEIRCIVSMRMLDYSEKYFITDECQSGWTLRVKTLTARYNLLKQQKMYVRTYRYLNNKQM